MYIVKLAPLPALAGAHRLNNVMYIPRVHGTGKRVDRRFVNVYT